MNEQEKEHRAENQEQHMIINHVVPLRERVIVLEKTVEYHDKELTKLTTFLHDLSFAIQRNTELVKKIWWLMIGGSIAATVLWSGLTFLYPIIESASDQQEIVDKLEK